MRHRCWLACLFAITVGHLALADDDTPPAEDAQSLVRQGVELRRAHKNQEALDAFRRAQALAPSAHIRAQLALAEQALGQWLGAADDLDAVLADADDAWIAKNREALQQARATVEGHLAFLTVDVLAPAPPSAHVDLDGLALVAGTETRVVAAPGTLVTRADDFAPDVQRIALGPGEHAKIAVSLVPLNTRSAPARMAPTPAPIPAPPARPRAKAVVGPIALASIGVAGLITGAVFGLDTIHDKHARDADCIGGCTAAGIAFDSRARTNATVSTVAFGAGAAFLVGGGAWWLFSGRGGPTVSARIAPGAIGLTVGGTL